MAAEAEEGRERPEVIDSTFRNGSVTAVGVVAGFSLGFLSRWGGAPGEWSRIDLVAVAVITAGIVLQMTALGLLLSIASLRVSRYNAAVLCFLIGFVLVFVGVGVALFAGILGIPSTVLSFAPA